MFCLGVIFLSTSVCAENRVFETTGIVKAFAGLYLEKKYPAIRLQKFGGKYAHSNFHFLFRISKILLEQRIGYGKSGRAIIVTHVAKWSERSDPPKDGWKSKSGKIKHFKVTQRSSVVYSLEQTERYCGSPTSDRGGPHLLEANLKQLDPD